MISIKPQLCYLFWPALVLWIWRERRGRLLSAGLIVGLTVAAIPALFNREIYSAYLALYKVGGLATPLDWAAPTLGNALRVWISPDRSALQFAPVAAGVAWLVYDWQRHRDSWNWTERLPILLLVSVSTSAYAWTFDQVVLLPAIMQSAGWILRARLTPSLCVFIVLYIVANAVYLVGKTFLLNDFWYFWMAPLFLLIYTLLQNRMFADAAR